MTATAQPDAVPQLDAVPQPDTAPQPIVSLQAREMATVAGRIVSIQVQPRDAAPSLMARVDDGTGHVDAVLMGRREIPGIVPGAHIHLTGRLCAADTGLRMYNPSFELSS